MQLSKHVAELQLLFTNRTNIRKGKRLSDCESETSQNVHLKVWCWNESDLLTYKVTCIITAVYKGIYGDLGPFFEQN